MSGGGGGTQQTQTIQKADPWAGQQPYLLDMFARAQGQANQPPSSYFPGQTVAAPGAVTTEGQNTALSMARSQLPGMSQAGVDYTKFLMGPGLDMANNPYLQSAITAAMNPVMQQFTQSGGPLSQIRANAIQNTSEGTSTRQGIAEGIATRGLTQQLSDMSARMTMDAYLAQQDQATRALALMPQTASMSLLPSQVMSQVGGQQDAYKQALLNEAVQRYMFNQQAPYDQLNRYAQLVGGSGYGSSSSGATIGEVPSMNPLLGGLGGAVAGGTIGSMLTPAGASMLGLNAVYPGAGALMGGLLGYFGSR